jgi:hypothetical protein
MGKLEKASKKSTSAHKRSKPRQAQEDPTSDDVKAVMKTSDWDCDGVSDYDDNCVYVYNPDQTDRNRNGIGDACEPKK